MGYITDCGICGSQDLVPVFRMGMQPFAERDTGGRYPLTVVRCGDCSLMQLSYIADHHEVFPANHPYATGNTAALREHFAALAATLAPLLAPGDVVVDIGANDGTLLSGFGGGLRRVAVEPTNQAIKCRTQGMVTYQEFFTAGTAAHIRHLAGPAKVITACNVLAHVPDVHDFMAGVGYLLADDGVFVTENHDVASITSGLQVDTVYHEHLRYYSVASLSRLLALHDLEVAAVERIGTHGGSFRVTARKERGGLQERADKAMTGLRAVLAQAAAEGPVYGIGAATRATPLIHYADIARYLACVCEVRTSEKIGQQIPGTSIPIVDEGKLIADQPPHALLLAHHIAGSIIPVLREKGYQGKFIRPLPRAEVLDD